jgi:hypothetical protein
MTTSARAETLDLTPAASVHTKRLVASSPPHDRSPGAARAAGILILGAFPVYGVGSSIALANTASAGSSGLLLSAGAASMLLNSVLVVAIAVLMLPTLRRASKRVASLYLGTRIFEGLGLGVGAMALLTMTGPTAVATNLVAYNVAMAGLGVGSLAFCTVLFRSGLAPRFLAVWGFVGYASFAAGCVLELAGVAGAGLPSTIPGAGFEVAFGIWLIAKGFRTVALRSVGA